MNFLAEKKEVAGRTVQKLQGAAQGGSVSTDTDTPMAVPGLDNSSLLGRKKDAVRRIDRFQPAGQTRSPPQASQTAPLEVAQAAAQPGAQAERVAQLISREVVSLRQTGADSLAVSLKLDAHTQNFSCN